MTCDSVTKYIFNAIPYLGKSTDKTDGSPFGGILCQGIIKTNITPIEP